MLDQANKYIAALRAIQRWALRPNRRCAPYKRILLVTAFWKRVGRRKRTKPPVEIGGWRGTSLQGSDFDRVRPLVANLLADYDEPVVLRERATRTQHGARGVF